MLRERETSYIRRIPSAMPDMTSLVDRRASLSELLISALQTQFTPSHIAVVTSTCRT